MVSLTGSDYVAVTASGMYTATRGGLQGVVFRLGIRAVPFDQFDLTLNRPDARNALTLRTYAELRQAVLEATQTRITA